MTHEQARALISAGERTQDVETHLAGCEACRAWDATLERIRGTAPHAFAEAPAGLADRVVGGVRTAAVAAPALLTATRIDPAEGTARVGARLKRKLAWRIATATGIAATVAAAALIVPRTNQPPSVAVAARKTADARTARFELTSSFSLRPAGPIPLRVPELSSLRRSIRSHLPQGLPSAVRSALAQAAQDLPTPRPGSIASISASASGRGEIAFPNRMHLAATVSENDGVTRQRGKTETVVVGSDVWMRTALFGDRWLRLPSFGAEITFGFEPTDLVRRLSRFDGSSKDLGVQTRGGARVRHYRLTEARDFGSFLGSRTVTVDVWVGDEDGLVRELLEVHTGDDEQGHLVARVRVRLFDFGTRASIKAPPPREVTTIDRIAAGFYGYGFGMAGGAFRFDFASAARMPDFSFPEIRIPEFTIPEIKLPRIEIPKIDIPTFTIPSFPAPSVEGSFGVEGSCC